MSGNKCCLVAVEAILPALGHRSIISFRLLGRCCHENCSSLFNRPGQRYSKMSHFKILLVGKLKVVPRVPNPGISKHWHMLWELRNTSEQNTVLLFSVTRSAAPGPLGPQQQKNRPYHYSSPQTPLKMNVAIRSQILALPS